MKIRESANIEESFFDIDTVNNTAKIVLEFERPEDIFDTNYISKTPVLSDDFSEWIRSAFRLVSSKYKIDLTVRFDDMENYTEDELREIFRKNIDLEFKSNFIANRSKNRIAFSLIGIGVAFFMAMLLINNLWDSASVWKDVFVYISDIATTVTFWEAMTILVVEQKEKRAYLKDLGTRFSSIRFCGSEKSE